MPRLIDGLGGERVIAISAGSWHSLLLVAGGGVYSFGDGSGGKLGHEDGGRMHLAPQRIAALDGRQVAAVAAGETHSLCMLRNGQVLSWGSGAALGLEAEALTDYEAEQPASWGSAGNYEWAPGDHEQRWQAHAPTPIAVLLS